MTYRAFTFLLGIILSVQLTFAQTTVSGDAIRLLDQWLEAQVDFDRLPGLTVGIVKNQELIWSKGYGKADVAKNIPVQPSTIFSICSISKLFTATAIMKLRDEGKLQLDDEVSKHLSWFTIKQQQDSGPITIRTLLTHSSGLPQEPDFAHWTESTFPTKEQIIEKISGQETLYPTSTYFHYSNLGITLLGFIIEQVSGVSFDTYVTDNILKPLRMNDTRTTFPENLWREKMATGYSELNRKGERKMVDKFQSKGMAASVGFTSNTDDLARFASWQFRLLEHGGKEIIKASTLKEMQQVQYMDPNWKTSRGLGFNIAQYDGKTFVSHGGYCPGYQTLLMENPKDKIAFIIMINAVGTDPYKYFHGMRSVLSKACEDDLTEKKENQKLEEYCGLYRDQLWGSEMVITPWGNYLAMVTLPCENPKHALTIIKPVTGDTFIRIREDGENGDPITFERDKAGKVQKVWRHSNYRVKVK
ncbi:MAG TPA: serine hydrolase [Ohtaekwangia sp.]